MTEQSGESVAGRQGGKGSYRDLVVWQKAMDLATRVYELTDSFPAREQYGLSQQIRKSAVSVPSNLAEGHGRIAGPQRVHFVEIAKGSLFELETQLELSGRLGFLSADQLEAATELTKEVGRTLNGLLRHLCRSRS